MARRGPFAGSHVAVSVVVCTLLACRFGSYGDSEVDDSDMRADVVECEDAVSKLQRCCPGFDGEPITCRYYFENNSGCGSSSTRREWPAIDLRESECIRNTDCAAMVDLRICERAQKARLRTFSSSSDTYSPSYGDAGRTDRTESTDHPPVCP